MHVTPELLVTRHNHLVDPSLHVWEWQIPTYLFLGGWVAGMMVLSGWFLLQERHEDRRCTCVLTPWISLVLLTLGMLALFLDLEHKLYVWRLYTTFEVSSPMSWGAWILVLVYPVLMATALIRVPAWLRARVRLAVSVENAIAAWRFAPRVARPLWNSALLGPLFLLSGLSSAAAFVHLVARRVDERELLARADNLFLTVELATILLFFVGLTTSTAAHKEAAALLLGGPFTAVFWVGVVGLGIAIPLFIQSLAVRHRVQHTPVAPLLVIAGGVVLRFVMVSAGQESRWASLLLQLLHGLA
jgi:formate-dependent nitrite reductase membrane component NrfD